MNENRGGHGNGRAEAGGPFEERAKAKGDQDDLDAWIRGEIAQAVPQDIELPFLDGQLVHEDQVENDPADRKQSVGGAEERSGSCRPSGHSVDEYRNRQRDPKDELAGFGWVGGLM